MKKKSDGDTRNFTPIRFALLCTAILLSMALLLGRVAWLQIVTPSKLVKQEDMRSLREVTTASPRGMITDREGRPLAVSVPVNAVWADPKTIISKGGVGYNERWQALAQRPTSVAQY
ncbi:penicillin-binding protein 2, partial [Salmonella enterica subsp. enterica serovar Hvittingfoss str. A4-620]